MKRQLLLSLTLSVLAANAFALPAAEQATPQVKDSHGHSVFTQTVAEGGSDRLIERNKVAADGFERTPQGQTVAEGGRDRLEQKGLVEDGYNRTHQGQTVAEGGADRLAERHQAVS